MSSQMPDFSPEQSYMDTSSNDTSPLSNEDVIAQKILKRAEIAKMTRQLKEKLFKAGMKVRDQNQPSNASSVPPPSAAAPNSHSKFDGSTSLPLSVSATAPAAFDGQFNSNSQRYTNSQHPHSRRYMNSSNSTTPSSSPSKSLSEDVTNTIAATAMSNIQNSKLVTPTKQGFSFDANNSMSTITPANISPLKRKSSLIYRSAGSVTSVNSSLMFNNGSQAYENEDMISPVKRIHSSPYMSGASPHQFTRGQLIQTPSSHLHLPSSNVTNSAQSFHPPKTPPQEQIDIFYSNHSSTSNRGHLQSQIQIQHQNLNNTLESNILKPSLKSEDTHYHKRLPRSNPNRKSMNKKEQVILQELPPPSSLAPPQQSLNPPMRLKSQKIDKCQDSENQNPTAIQLDSQKDWHVSQPGLLSTPKAHGRVREFTTPDRNNANNNGNGDNDLGADLLLFLSNSPARTFTGKDKVLTIPTTPKASNHLSNNGNNASISRGAISLLESTPLKSQVPNTFFASPSLLGTPIGITKTHQTNSNNLLQHPATPNNRLHFSAKNNINRTPGFSMSDFINFTPSPRVLRTPDHLSAYNTQGTNANNRPIYNYSKELNMITSIKEDE